MTVCVEPDWWKTLFDQIYLSTDARSVCDDALTSRETDIICDLLPLRPEDRILDLCGGHGRHSLDLCGRGFEGCTVLDYSQYLVEHGKASAADQGQRVCFMQGDARSTKLEDDSFDHVLIMGNSLGYLSETGADREILAEAHRVVRPGGWMLVDAADGDAIARSFAENAWHEIGPDMVVCRQRELRDGRMCVRELVLSKEKGLVRDGNYAIRLFDHEALVTLIEATGFRGVESHTDLFLHRKNGDYGFLNKRMILTAVKPER